MAEEVSDFFSRQIENQQVGIDHWDGVAPDDDQGKKMQRERTLYKLRHNEPGKRDVEPPFGDEGQSGESATTASFNDKIWYHVKGMPSSPTMRIPNHFEKASSEKEAIDAFHGFYPSVEIKFVKPMTQKEIEIHGVEDTLMDEISATAMIISKREKTGQSDRDVMLLEYGRLSDEGLSEEEIVNKIAEGFLPIGFDIEYWSKKVREVLEDTLPKMGQQQDPSKLDTYHFDQDYEMGTTPVSRTDPLYRDNFIGNDLSHGTSPGVKIEKKDRKRKFKRRMIHDS